jgi:hypothetical protein
MAVFAIHSFRPVPGRAGDLIGSMATAKKILERNGARIFVWSPVAGGDAGTLTFVDAYGSAGDYGRTMDALGKDQEWLAFWAGVMADPSGINVENYLLNDLDPTEVVPVIQPGVRVGVTFKTRPGRLADHLAAAATARGHLERLGGRVRTVQAFGRADSTITTLIGFEDFTHYGEFGEKLAVDEGWAGFWIGMAADPPAEQVDSTIVSRLDLPE